jgi:hypothetical protein
MASESGKLLAIYIIKKNQKKDRVSRINRTWSWNMLQLRALDTKQTSPFGCFAHKTRVFTTRISTHIYHTYFNAYFPPLTLRHITSAHFDY